MRKLLFSLSALLLLVIVSEAQAPAFINYQGVARNSVGNALVNQAIGLRLTIRDYGGGGPPGIPVYSETRSLTTNAFGLFNIQIGGPGANNVTGTILGINWKLGPKFLQVEIDDKGGASYKDIGTTRLTSVPYSLFANQAADLVLPFIKSQSEEFPLFQITNTGNNANSLSYEGKSNSTANNAAAIRGIMTSVSPGEFSVGVMGQNNGTGTKGIGVYGNQNGSGWGVYGNTPGGIGVYGNSISGMGVYGQSVTGISVMGYQPSNGTSNSGFFQNVNQNNAAATLRVLTNGGGTGLGGEGLTVTTTGLGPNAILTTNNNLNGKTVLQATTNGFGKVAFLQNTNTNNSNPVLEAQTNGMNTVGFLQNTNTANAKNVFEVQTNGMGKVGVLENTNAANTANAFDVRTNGLNRAGYLENTNATNTSNVLEVQTNGMGKIGVFQNTNTTNPANALEVTTNGLSRVGFLQNTNAANISNVVEVQSNGLGRVGFLQNTGATNTSNVLEVQTNGMGRTGVLQNTNVTNATNTFDVRTNGLGRVGFLQNTGATNTSNVLEVQTNGTGRTGLLQNTNAANAANVFEVQTNGMGKVGVLQNTNAANTANALDVTTNGLSRVGYMENTNAANTSNVLEVKTNGMGKVGVLQNTNVANTANALDVTTNGLNRVGFLQNTGATNTSNVLEIQTNGMGKIGMLQNTNAANTANGLDVRTNGLGRVGFLQNTGATNTSNVLEIQTNGTGRSGLLQNTNAANTANVLEVQTNGMGKVGVLENTNAANTANAFDVRTNGLNRAGFFQNTGGTNTSNVLEVQTNGMGKTGFLQNTNATNAANVFEVQTNGTGRIGVFQNTNAASTSNSLHVMTNGTGYAAHLQNTNASPKALLTNGSVLINDITQSLDSVTGALVIRKVGGVGGGLGVEGNLNVGGSAAFSGDVSFKAPVKFLSPLESTSPTTGAVTVVGGAGIGSRLNVQGAVAFSSTLTVTGNTTLNGATNTINNKLNANGQVTINANPGSGTENLYANYPLQVQGSNQGIAIRVNGSRANANNFVSFWDGTQMWGRIEGETLPELLNNDDYKVALKSLELAITMATIDVVTGGIEVIMAGVDLVGASTSSTACAGLGVCVTAPVPSLIIAAGVNLAAAIANEIAVALGLDDAITQKNYFVNTSAANIGVTYQSGSGDYAEWLPKENTSEKFMPGYIVGIKNGSITLNTAGADKLFVVSTKPIVLGNMPEAGKEDSYEKVAFMGQVPVHVLGKVNAGDYILPSGHNNGFGKAVSPDKMKPEDYAKIVGMAWSSSTNETYSMINVAIGLNTGDVSKLVAQQSDEINTLKGQINETNAILAKLVPGFKEAAGLKDVVEIYHPVIKSNPVSSANSHPVEFVKQDASNIVYFDITTEQTNIMLDKAQQLFIEKGGNVNTHPFWNKINSDPGYKAIVMNQMKKIFREGMHMHNEINSDAKSQVSVVK